MDERPRRLLDEQIEYYRARAPEYDDWFLRRGRYDRGPEHRARWEAEVGRVDADLASMAPFGEVLEPAAGTGLWTGKLLAGATGVTAVDASEEALELNRRRLPGRGVEYVVADLFTWRPDRRWDFVFLGFWLSHVPESRFDAFWELVERCLRPGGRVFLVDSALTPESMAKDHPLPRPESGVAGRRLADGRSYRVVKVFREPRELERRLAASGWRARMRRTREFFVYGRVERRREGD